MSKKRINIIDEARGFCVILMVIYHLLYSLSVIFGIEAFYGAFSTARVFQPIIPILFIFISGVSFNLSQNNIKRGLILLLISALITVTLLIFMPEQVIWFGILHFLAAANIICGLLKKPIGRIPFAVGTILCVFLFLFTYNAQRGFFGFEGIFAYSLPRQLYSTNFLAPLGFFARDFRSADYYPFLPWIFLFLLGIIVGRNVRDLPESPKRPHVRPLAFLGRHALVIYLVHQPIIVGAGYLITALSGHITP